MKQNVGIFTTAGIVLVVRRKLSPRTSCLVVHIYWFVLWDQWAHLKLFEFKLGSGGGASYLALHEQTWSNRFDEKQILLFAFIWYVSATRWFHVLVFHAHCLPWLSIPHFLIRRQLAWTDKPYFLGKSENKSKCCLLKLFLSMLTVKWTKIMRTRTER